jgi:hypothetical protein
MKMSAIPLPTIKSPPAQSAGLNTSPKMAKP